MISIEIAQYFNTILVLTVLFLSLFTMQRWRFLSANQLIHHEHSNWTAIFIISLIFCILVGFRPLSAKLFGDTVNYALSFRLITQNPAPSIFGEKDWLFDYFTYYSALNSTVSIYFTIIALGYVFFALYGIRYLFKNGTYGATLFFFGAFSFWAYAINGLRNGLAGSIFILALALILNKKKNIEIIIGIILCYIAYSIHKSTALPIVCLFSSIYIIKSTKQALYFWILSIFACLVASNQIEAFFTTLGFDDRLTTYINNAEEYKELGYKTGFRIDFLLYSFMPILLGYYITIKRKINNRTYQIILNTYILSNSFWVMMMNASYSNRFAYLSWFLYPIVLAYPCLRMNIWGQSQGENAGKILFAHSAFTAFMNFIYY